MRRRLLFPLYCVALVLGIGEVLVRLSGYSDRYIYDAIYAPFGDDAEIPYVHKPNLRGADAWGNTVIDTDALGLRSRAGDPALAARKPPDEVRIAVLGDSVTFGEGVETDATFCRRLEEMLGRAESGRRVRVLNFGVSAYSVKQMAATLERRALALQPDLVVTVLIPADFDVARTGTLDPWGYVRFDANGEHAALKHALQHVHLVYLVRDLYHRRHGGWPARSIDTVPESYAYLTRMRDVCAVHALDCVVVLVSTKIDSGFGPVRKRLEHDGIAVLDLSALRDEFADAVFNASPHDPHPSAAVHGRIAAELAAWIRTRPLGGGPARHVDPS